MDQSLEALIKLDEFFQLKNLGVIRDADNDSSKAFQKVRNSLKRFNLPAPDQAYEYVRVAVAIVPDANSEGNLETLCLRTLDKSKLACIEKYIDCITRNNTPVKGERSFTRKIVFLSHGWCRKKVVITQDINLDFEWVSLQMLMYGNGIHRILSGLKNFYSNYQARAISFINVAQ